ncbi:hypothetical protein ACSW8L_15670 (plasmid) [Clostridium perfringens]
MIIDKSTIKLSQGICKKDCNEFTREEINQFLMDYIEWIESKGLITGGGCDYYKEEE